MSIYHWLSRMVRRAGSRNHYGGERIRGCPTRPRPTTQNCERLLAALRKERTKKHSLELRLLEIERQHDATRRDLEHSQAVNGELIEALAELEQRLQAMSGREFSAN